MMKKALAVFVLLSVLLLAGCGAKTKTVHCDHCGKELTISESSNMDEDWIVYCKDCEKELGLDKIVE